MPKTLAMRLLSPHLRKFMQLNMKTVQMLILLLLLLVLHKNQAKLVLIW